MHLSQVVIAEIVRCGGEAVLLKVFANVSNAKQ